MEFATKILWYVLTSVLSLLIGYFIREPIDNWRRRRVRIREATKPRMIFSVVQLADPRNKGFDFSREITEQNSCQNLFEYEIDDNISLSVNDASELKNLEEKNAFIDKIRHIIRKANKPNGVRTLVITDIPLPDNYYGWNSKERDILVTSLSSVERYFLIEESPTIEDFIIMMVKRMTLFSVIPTLNPRDTHSKKSIGCLFDFTVRLARVVGVVSTPFICPKCKKHLRRCKGTKFALQASDWVEAV